MEQSSATASVDPDRLTIQYFEQGGANPQKEEIAIVEAENNQSSEDKRCATFAIKNEDHTLGNALRHVIMRNPDVDFCGYSIPHPSEAKIHLRIQTRGIQPVEWLSLRFSCSLGPPAIDILRKGLDDLEAAMECLLRKFDAAVESQNYEKYPDLEI